MLKFILVASMVILFLIFSIPILVVEKHIGKTDPEKRDRQCLAIVQFMFRLILKAAGIHITVKGMENIPENTPVLYVGNHRSYFDILVGYTTVPTRLGFMAKKEMEQIPLLSSWMKNVNCLFLDRQIAEKTGCPVVPVAITGTAEAYENHFPRIRSSQVTIEFGTPFIIKGLEPERKKFAGAHTRQLIIDMLQEEKRLREGR